MKGSLYALAVVAVAMGFAAPAFAADSKSEGQSKVEIKEVTGQKNKVVGDIDEEIQNAKMRAESGSKSKFSGTFTVNYQGGNVSSPFNEKRPNLSGDPAIPAKSNLQGKINARYRFDKSNSLTLGTTYAIMTPFHGSTRKSNILDPLLGYNYVAKLGDFQTSTTFSYGYGTSNESKALDNTHQASGSINAMRDFGGGFTAGASVSVGYNYYTSAPGAKPPDDKADTSLIGYGNDTRRQWIVGIFPQAEYKLSDRYALRTVFGYFNWAHMYGDRNNWRLLQTHIYQSVGVGISVTRDIYVYPNVQFLPDKMSLNNTNVAVSTTINVF